MANFQNEIWAVVYRKSNFQQKKKKIEVARWGSVRVFSNFEMGN